VQLRVTQMQNKSAQAQMAINAFARDLEDCKLKMIPHVIGSEQKAFRFLDESNGKGKPKEVVVNQVVEEDMLGDPIKVINRLDGAKYDVVEVETDDSPTGREADLTAFVQIMQNVLPNTPPEFWPVVLGQIPNATCQKIAKAQKEAAEAAAKEPQKPQVKTTATLDMSKVSFDPTVREAAEYLGVLPPSQAAPPAAAPPPETAGTDPGAIA
jgi:hypothetical protein